MSRPPFSYAELSREGFAVRIDEALRKASEKLLEERTKFVNDLTEQQFIEAMRQALASGDFMRLVNVEYGSQAVAYVPFRERFRLEHRISELEGRLALLLEGGERP